jgi:hypothetical protein
LKIVVNGDVLWLYSGLKIVVNGWKFGEESGAATVSLVVVVTCLLAFVLG